MQAPQKRGPANALNQTSNTRRSKCLEEMEKARMVRGREQEEARAAAARMAQRKTLDAVRAVVKAEVKVRAKVKVRGKVKAEDNFL